MPSRAEKQTEREEKARHIRKTRGKCKVFLISIWFDHISYSKL